MLMLVHSHWFHNDARTVINAVRSLTAEYIRPEV